MADKDLVVVHVVNAFVDSDGTSVRDGNNSVAPDVAERWESQGRASILPHPEWRAAHYKKGHVPKWVKDLKEAAIKASSEVVPDVVIKAPEKPIKTEGAKS